MSVKSRSRTILVSLGLTCLSMAIAFSIRSRSLTENLTPPTATGNRSQWWQERLDRVEAGEVYTQAIAQGQENLETEQYDAAVADFSEAIQKRPETALGYHGRALARLKLEDYQGAIADLTRALDIEPEDVRAYGNRGSAYQKLGDHSLALQDYDRAIELYPSYSVAHFNRASLYYELGEYDLALQGFNQTVLLDPNNARAFYNRGLVYANLGDTNAAIADLETAEALFRKQENFLASERTLATLASLEDGTFQPMEPISGKRPAKIQ